MKAPGRGRTPCSVGRRRRALCGALCLAVMLSGCSGLGDPRADVAVVNGEKIYLKDFKREIEQAQKLAARDSALGPEESRRLQEEVLTRLINDKVMLLRARKLGLSVSNDELMQRIREIKKDYAGGSFDELLAAEKIDFALWREQLRDSLLLEKLIVADLDSHITVTEDEAKDYYRTHRDEYRAGKQVHVAQIIVRDRRRAEEIRARLKRGEDFSTLAREASIGPEAAAGGDLGFFRRGVMPEAVDQAIFSLSPGQTSRIVKSPYGYHIFKMLARDEGGRKGFDAVSDRVLADMKKERREKEYPDWLAGLRAGAVVKRNEEVLKKMSVAAPPAKAE